jgi:hypothetical protein
MQFEKKTGTGLVFMAMFSLMTHEAFGSMNYRNDLAAIIEVSNGGPWGEWQEPRFCNPGTYARGFALGVEPPIDGDDTALNDVALYCAAMGTGFVSDSFTAPGATPWAQWSTASYCPSGSFIRAYRLRVEQPIDGDDTAANSMQASCNDGALLTASNGGPWGDWGNWAFCPADTAVCGASLKVETPIGEGDDTAVNNVRLYCCQLD